MSTRPGRQGVTTAVPTRRSARLSAKEPISNDNIIICEPTHPEVNSNCLAKGSTVSTTHEQEPRNHHQLEGFDISSTVLDTSSTWRGQRNEAPKMRRIATTNVLCDADAMAYITKTATAEDRQSWKGWCEIESEPAFFNVMLREFGVDGIKVQEVLSLDDEMLASLSKPVYGLIFLFQFKEDDPTKQETSCPDHIWFANQTTSNACASIALLNIIMNISGIELGPTLKSLKDFTATMEPAVRGYQVCNHDYIRVIHNSFARKMDMLNADLALSNEAKSKSRPKRRTAAQEDQDQPGFHFIAFVPIEGNVWKLDGLERQPMNLGKYGNDWMQLALPMIKERMHEYEGDQIQFNLLSLCKNPLLTIPTQLALNVNNLINVEKCLSHLQPDWHSFSGDESGETLRGPNATFLLTPELLDMTKFEAFYKPGGPSITAANLIEIRAQLLWAQAPLRAAIIDELAAVDQDNKRATNRRHDYTPMIYTWVRFLAENGTLQGLVEKAERERERERF